MGYPIHRLGGSALRILIAWLLALPMTAAYAAAATAHAPFAIFAMELCRGAVLDPEAPDQDAPAKPDHSLECCLACVPAPPPRAEAEIPVPAAFTAPRAPRAEIISVATAGLGPQSARAPPL